MNNLYETGTTECGTCGRKIDWKRDFRQSLSNRQLHVIEMQEDKFINVSSGSREVTCPTCSTLVPLKPKTEFWAKYHYAKNGKIEYGTEYITVNLSKYDEGFHDEATKIIKEATGILDAKFLGEA